MHVPVIHPLRSWLVAYCRSLMCHLRPGEDLRAELEGKLKPEVSSPAQMCVMGFAVDWGGGLL